MTLPLPHSPPGQDGPHLRAGRRADAVPRQPHDDFATTLRRVAKLDSDTLRQGDGHHDAAREQKMSAEGREVGRSVPPVRKQHPDELASQEELDDVDAPGTDLRFGEHSEAAGLSDAVHELDVVANGPDDLGRTRLRPSTEAGYEEALPEAGPQVAGNSGQVDPLAPIVAVAASDEATGHQHDLSIGNISHTRTRHGQDLGAAIERENRPVGSMRMRPALAIELSSLAPSTGTLLSIGTPEAGKVHQSLAATGHVAGRGPPQWYQSAHPAPEPSTDPAKPEIEWIARARDGDPEHQAGFGGSRVTGTETKKADDGRGVRSDWPNTVTLPSGNSHGDKARRGGLPGRGEASGWRADAASGVTPRIEGRGGNGSAATNRTPGHIGKHWSDHSSIPAEGKQPAHPEHGRGLQGQPSPGSRVDRDAMTVERQGTATSLANPNAAARDLPPGRRGPVEKRPSDLADPANMGSPTAVARTEAVMPRSAVGLEKLPGRMSRDRTQDSKGWHVISAEAARPTQDGSRRLRGGRVATGLADAAGGMTPRLNSDTKLAGLSADLSGRLAGAEVLATTHGHAEDPVLEEFGPGSSDSRGLSDRAAPAGEARHLPRHIGRQMAEMVTRVREGAVEIALDPPELGRLRMQIATVDQSLVISVSAERGETMEMIRRHIQELGEQFRDLGYEDISFSFGGDAGFGAGAAQDQNTGTSEGNAATDPIAEPGAAAERSRPPSAMRGQPGHGLDLRL